MKALSVWQPWASLLVLGIKDVENRSWRQNHRGPLLIHAGQRADAASWAAAREILPDLPDELDEAIGPYGALLGMVDVIDYTRSEKCHSPWANTEPGGWCWSVANARAFKRPIDYRGQQGLFEVSNAILVEARGFRRAG